MHRLAAILAVSISMGLSGCGGSGQVESARTDSIDPPRFARSLDPGPGVSAVLTLEQNWTDDESIWFYNAPQGSRLIPYEWFLHLEQADQETLFADNEHIRQLGYLPRDPGKNNPDGLPIGFIWDAAYDDGTPGLGMTCAACHTTQIDFTLDGITTAYLVDGAPTLGDFEGLQRALESALQATLGSEAKFSRFANRVIPAAGEAERDALREKLRLIAEERRRYNELNLSGTDAPDYGHGRVDAFGGIMNQVAVAFIGNPANYAVANAPVSYPCLWDTPQHDVVQWNGSGPNLSIPEVESYIGTAEIGELVRNAGQVLGVFGMLDPSLELNRWGGYRSTVNTDSIIAAGALLKSLFSPQWPELFGAVDQSKADAGAALFAQACQGCHENHKLIRDDPGRTIQAQMHVVGTDPAMATNFARRTAETGILAGRFERLAIVSTGEPLGTREPLAKLVLHSASRAVAGPDQLGSVYTGPLGSFSTANIDLPPAPQRPELAYKARPLNGIWATAPYLHNGSVPNLWELLKSPTASEPANRRIAEFYVGDREYDPTHVGFRSSQGPFRFDASLPGNSNSGHTYGADLSDEQKWQLIEYIKTL